MPLPCTKGPVAMELDRIDKQILNLIQDKFPVCSRPFKTIGDKIGVPEEEIISRLENLVKNDIVRRIGGIFDSRSIGYRGTLCAVKVADHMFKEVVDVINGYDEITHNYLRNHDYNVWFTVLARAQEEIDAILDAIKRKTGIKEILDLPAERYYKIKVKFNVEESNHT